jgi:hypothetical protein
MGYGGGQDASRPVVIAAGLGDEGVASSTMTTGEGTLASTHVGELRRAALRGSMRACRARWPERLLCRGGDVGVLGLALGGRSSMS